MAQLWAKGCKDIQRFSHALLGNKRTQRLRRPAPFETTDQPKTSFIFRQENHGTGISRITCGEDVLDFVTKVFLKASCSS